MLPTEMLHMIYLMSCLTGDSQETKLPSFVQTGKLGAKILGKVFHRDTYLKTHFC